MLGESLKIKWKNKVLNGQYIRSVDRQLTGGEEHVVMAVEGRYERETGSEIIAAQYQALQFKCLATKILQTETDSKCRL